MTPGLPSWAQVSRARRAHVERVAALLTDWAAALKVSADEGARWTRAAYLHDALRDAERRVLDELAPEWSHLPSVQHGPAAAVMAERHGERDRGVLDAIRYHTVGYQGWDDAGRMLYLADYLEPGRSFHRDERQALAERVPREPAAVLRAVARERLRRVIDAGHPLLQETSHFWNALVSATS